MYKCPCGAELVSIAFAWIHARYCFRAIARGIVNEFTARLRDERSPEQPPAPESATG